MLPVSKLAAGLLPIVVAVLAACGQPQPTDASPARDAEPKPTAAPLDASVAPAPSAETSAAPEAKTLPGHTEGCPGDMVRVEGEYCPAVVEECIERHQEYKRHADQKNVSERCLRYAKPTHCVSKHRQHESFCMDRYEYPNRVGELPRVLTSWTKAKTMCAADSKRLCTEDEFNFACEGPESLPYVNGFERDASICNIDKPYRYPDHSRVLPMYDECLATPWCAAELTRLDQREKIGERTTCVGWSGAYDLNGNVNEWVEIPGQKAPNRSGLKGGWWGPVRDRCRPTVTFHKENDYGYEAGFRCCKDASG